MTRLFGTDGVRGLANAYPLTGDMAFRIAQYGTFYLLAHQKKENRPIYVGKDTRRSGDMLEHAVAAGVASMGVEVKLLGVIPTPAVAFITSELSGLGGIVISASHNPFQDNGIKIFGGDGFKISDEIEASIESAFANHLKIDLTEGAGIGSITNDSTSVNFWLNHIGKLIGDHSMNRRMKIALDCANGALSPWATKFFSDLGFKVDVIGAFPDGININEKVGSTSIGSLMEIMKKDKFDVGFAFDGDADRVIALTSTGDVIDGDFILAILAKYLKQKDRLACNTLVTTVMSNLGLDLAMKELNVKVHKTRVGDRFVLEEMQKVKGIIGGEQSGHIILSEYATTGDGLLTASLLIKIIQESGMTLKELSTIMSKLPQILVNIKVRNKNFQTIPEIKEEIRVSEEKLSGRGRVLIRPSGTENLVRLMAEGPDENEIRTIVNDLAKVISAHLC